MQMTIFDMPRENNMVIYWFNNKDNKLYKLHPKKLDVRRDWYYKDFAAYVSRSESPRKEKHIRLAFEEGKVRYKSFWLNDEDDDKATEIRNKFLTKQIEIAMMKIANNMR